MTSPRTVLAALAALSALACVPARADDGTMPRAWWFGVEAGASSVRQSFTGAARRSTEFALAARGGVVVAPGLLLGAELGGVLLESSNLNDPGRGRGISQVFAIVQVHPQDGPLFVRAGLGPASFWGQHAEDRARTGWGGVLAAGYEGFGAADSRFGPVITFGGGRVGGANYRSLTLGLSGTFR